MPRLGIQGIGEAYRRPETIDGFTEKFGDLADEYKTYFKDELKLAGTTFRTEANQEKLKAIIR